MGKLTKRILSLLFLLFLLIAADRVLTYMLEPFSRAVYFLHDMQEMKKSGDGPDMIIVGNSRSVYGFDPRIFEEELGLQNVYNASVVGQQISSKYYIAEAMINSFEPEIVVFDIEWQSLNDFGTSRTQAKLLGLDRIAELCKAKGISLFLVSPPITTMKQMNIGNYQEAYDYYLTYAAEKDVPYHNLNMLRNKDEIFGDGSFYDSGHMCESGAAEASRLYARIIRDELDGKDTSGQFYKTMDELAADIRRVVAVGAEVRTEGRSVMIREVRSSAGKGINPEISVEVSADGKEWTTAGTIVPPDDSLDLTWDRKKIHVRITAADAESGTSATANYTANLK